MKKALVIEKRIQAQELFKKGWSIRKISHHLTSSKDSVSRWIKMKSEELFIDHRGWKKGKGRIHTEEEKRLIIDIRKELEDDESYFIGGKVVQKNYENKSGKKLPLSFINLTLKEAGLIKSPLIKPKKRSRYMQYPEKKLRRLGKIVMSVDFIGPKYLKGSNNRINFLSCKYIRPRKTGIVKRISGQTSDDALQVLEEIWQDHPIPDVLKIDNDSAFGGNLSHDECIGRFTFFLLNLGVTPVYVAPRSPWNNGNVEGHNSVFSKKFWKRIKFQTEEELDINITDFNLEYEKYNDLIGNNPEIKECRYIGDYDRKKLFNRKVAELSSHKIIFLRVVRREGEKEHANEQGFIDILGRRITLKKDLINLFVYSELDLKKEKLFISVEEESGKLRRIKQQKYSIKNVEW